MRNIPHSEKELLRLLADGNEHAFQVIFERHWDAVFSTALLLAKSASVAEDVAQDVFTMLWEKRVSLAGVEKLENFLFIAARNMIYSRFRKLASQDAYRQYVLSCFREDGAERVDETAELRELDRTIQQAIRLLPPQQQRAFRLSRYEGMQHEEIAVTMGVSRVTIKSYIVQAIASLRKALANHPSGAHWIVWAFFWVLSR
ncbi:RNA polymerase sigma factor [Chitinophaga sp. GCM10012297]|uniref:Sigma-70 family RNA polymerase sigma factor n=1 Tax=Chitinophaga chungangae TaxID=2821488 RepID=A0ABS3YH43_9BACT|nr:sigma-70 family RNA polymerase sigma factor [Chitinophaga chungangae]MBO9154004.1 sigma-70 family RNA polymerase sigma factor [Chitinophaga chungangae]